MRAVAPGRLLAALLAALTLVACNSSPLRCRQMSCLDFDAPPPSAYPQTIGEAGGPLVVIGDTQRTSFLECLIGREVNDRETRILLDSIAGVQPGALVMVGYLTFDGSDPLHWGWFDLQMRPILQNWASRCCRRSRQG